MKYAIILTILLIVSFSPVFAENTLQNTNLIAQSVVISLDVTFGEDTINPGFTRDYITNHLDDIRLTFYGDEIQLTDPKLKMTNTGNHFRIHSVPEGVLIYGHKNIELDNYNINVLIATDKELFRFPLTANIQTSKVIQIIPDEILRDPLTEEQKRLEELQNVVVIPRSNYTLSEDKIHVLTQVPFRIPWMSYYGFDIRVVDPVMNNLRDYYDTTGQIGDVEITGSIKDSLGNVLKSFSDNTGGHYSNSVYIPENINTRGPFSLELFATKYFDENASFATYSIIEEFFVFIPSDGGTRPSCSADELLAPDGTCVAECPEGTELDEDFMCREI